MRASLLDGLSGRPRPGRAEIVGDELVFVEEDGQRLVWNVAQVLAQHRVAAERHLEIAVQADEPSVTLIVDAGFAQRVEQARARFGGVGVGARAWLSRLGLGGWLIVALIALPLAYLAYTALLVRAHVLISPEAEARLGEFLYESMVERWTIVEDDGFGRLVDTMVSELVQEDPSFDVRVTLVDEDVPNAFALPGGRVIVFAGLLETCPDADALAGVLAHEIAHVEERHGLKHLFRTLGVLYFATGFVGGGIEELATVETIAELSSGLLILRHSREHEREADRLAIEKLAAAGRSATGLIEFLHTFESSLEEYTTWISTHPSSGERIERLTRLAGDVRAEPRPWLDEAQWNELCERLVGR